MRDFKHFLVSAFWTSASNRQMEPIIREFLPSLLPLHVCYVIKTRRHGSATFRAAAAAAAVRTAPVIVCFRGFVGEKWAACLIKTERKCFAARWFFVAAEPPGGWVTFGYFTEPRGGWESFTSPLLAQKWSKSDVQEENSVCFWFKLEILRTWRGLIN